MQNLSYESEFHLHENVALSGTHFHMKGFARKLVLKQRQKATQKWPIHSLRICCSETELGEERLRLFFGGSAELWSGKPLEIGNQIRFFNSPHTRILIQKSDQN